MKTIILQFSIVKSRNGPKKVTMSKTVDHNLIRDPELIDVADESWAEELPVEGMMHGYMFWAG